MLDIQFTPKPDEPKNDEELSELKIPQKVIDELGIFDSNKFNVRVTFMDDDPEIFTLEIMKTFRTHIQFHCDCGALLYSKFYDNFNEINVINEAVNDLLPKIIKHRANDCLYRMLNHPLKLRKKIIQSVNDGYDQKAVALAILYLADELKSLYLTDVVRRAK